MWQVMVRFKPRKKAPKRRLRLGNVSKCFTLLFKRMLWLNTMKREKKVFYTPKDEVERYNIGSIDLLNYNNGGCLMFGKLEKSGRFC